MWSLIFLLTIAMNPSFNANVAVNDQDGDVLNGAWQSTDANNGDSFVLVIVDGHISITSYHIENQKFNWSKGGSLEVGEDQIIVHTEFNTSDSSKVGKKMMLPYKMDGSKLVLRDEQVWTRVDDGQPGELNGAWLITGRKRNGEMSRRSPGARKTMKILSGTRFQWIAYNTANGKFFGTGGGTYTTVNGEYVENIDFFSRDGSRVGASLSFTYSIEDGEWHHSGLSSKGNPIYEIWTRRSMIEQ